MVNITKKSVGGDLEVGRDIVTGGSLTVRQRAEFGGRVTVKGFLDAPNLKVPCKGIFGTLTELRNAYLRPQSGWYAYVLDDTESGDDAASSGASAVEYSVYVAAGGKWEYSHKSVIETTAEMESVAAELACMSEEIATLQSEVFGDTGSESGEKSLSELLAALEERVDALEESGEGDTETISGLRETVDAIKAALERTATADSVKELAASVDGRIEALARSINDIVGADGGEGESLSALYALFGLLRDGRWGGVARFNGVAELGDTELVTEGSLEDSGEGDFVGVLWLTDRRMFVGVRARVAVDCGRQYIVHTYHTDWRTARLYMENPGEERGLWRDKIYIHAGGVWVWDGGKGQVVKAGGGPENVLSDADIDRIMSGFQFTDIGNIVRKATGKGEGLMDLEAHVEDDIVRIKARTNIKGVTRDDVIAMFDKVEQEEAESSVKE